MSAIMYRFHRVAENISITTRPSTHERHSRPTPTQVMAMARHNSKNSPPDDQHSAEERPPILGAASGKSDYNPYRDAKAFRDAEGAQWFAHEVAGEALGGGPACLLLVSGNQVRRIVSFPAEWRTLSSRHLLDLPFSTL